MIDRLCAWLLLVGIVLYFVSGYGITKGVINPKQAYHLHAGALNIIVIVAFVFHSAFATRLALMR